MEEHPVAQPIQSIDTSLPTETWWSGYAVGDAGVTRIEATQKSGMHANIPYVRVWAGEVCLAEFCQHSLAGVYFANPNAPTAGPAVAGRGTQDAPILPDPEAGQQPGDL